MYCRPNHLPTLAGANRPPPAGSHGHQQAAAAAVRSGIAGAGYSHREEADDLSRLLDAVDSRTRRDPEQKAAKTVHGAAMGPQKTRSVRILRRPDRRAPR